MAKILTRRKEIWVDRFKPDYLRGDVLTPNIGVEIRYLGEIALLIDLMTSEVAKQLKALFETEHAQEYFGQDKSVSAEARILTNALKLKFKNLFAARAKPMAERFTKSSEKSSSASLHNSLQKLSGGLSLGTSSISGPLKDVLSATVTENVNLIKSIPEQYLTQVQGAVMRSITTGNGLQDLVPFLADQKGITLRRARMIANDQTRKAFNNINKGRMQQVGLQEYEWLHTGGSSHPRKEHIAMSGKIYRFDQPPIIDEKTGERGIPGQAINCRCRMRPVISFTGE